MSKLTEHFESWTNKKRCFKDKMNNNKKSERMIIQVRGRKNIVAIKI